MTLSQIACMSVLLTAVAACTTVPRIVNEYKIDVQQGNVLTQDMVAQLKPGLSKDQVRFVLGTPVLMDMFHANRWDYVYRMQKGNGTIEMRQFSAFFDANDKLVRVGGDVAAAQPVDIAAVPESKSREIDLGSIAPDSVAPPLEEKGFFGRMMESVGF
jgi:outer membrane protein assembly factor BamE